MSLVWQSVFQSLPLGEGGSRVPRKRETDEGKIKEATSSALRAPSPLRRRLRGTDCHTSLRYIMV